MGVGEGRGPELAAGVVGEAEGLEDALEVLGAGEVVDVGEALAQVVVLRADHAAHDDDLEVARPSRFSALRRPSLLTARCSALLAHDAGVERRRGRRPPAHRSDCQPRRSRPAASFAESATFI